MAAVELFQTNDQKNTRGTKMHSWTTQSIFFHTQHFEVMVLWYHWGKLTLLVVSGILLLLSSAKRPGMTYY